MVLGSHAGSQGSSRSSRLCRFQSGPNWVGKDGGCRSGDQTTFVSISSCQGGSTRLTTEARPRGAAVERPRSGAASCT